MESGANKKEKVILYIHGKGGSAKEADHYIDVFPGIDVIGYDYQSETPWDAKIEFENKINEISQEYVHILVVANSIGAYFLMNADIQKSIEKAYFISPIVNMERLILDMMTWANVSESKLQEKKEIVTAFGEVLSWEYLTYVRNNPIQWSVPTHILYGEKDTLTSTETLNQFVSQSNSDITIMPQGEHWFHTSEQMEFLDRWICVKENLVDKVKYIHTTEMGKNRIKKNLGLQEDVVKYCQKKVLDSHSKIYQKGKNWYCETEKETITINAKSLTIITAHRRKGYEQI